MFAVRPMLFAARRRAARSTRPCTVQHIRSPNCGRSIGALELAFNMGRSNHLQHLQLDMVRLVHSPLKRNVKELSLVVAWQRGKRRWKNPPRFFLIHAVPHRKARAPLGTSVLGILEVKSQDMLLRALTRKRPPRQWLPGWDLAEPNMSQHTSPVRRRGAGTLQSVAEEDEREKHTPTKQLASMQFDTHQPAKTQCLSLSLPLYIFTSTL